MSGLDYHFWTEPKISKRTVSCPRPDEEIQLIPRPLFHSRRTDIIRSGLSPNCHRAFLATRNSIRLIALKKPTTRTPQWTSEVIAEEPIAGIEDAVLSDQYLAVLTSTKVKKYIRFGLELYKYKSRGHRHHLDHIHSLECWDIEGWVPTCLAIRDSDDRQLCPRVLVGGNGHGPEIRLYEMYTAEETIAGSSKESNQLPDSPQQVLERLHTFNPKEIDGVTAVGFSQGGESIAVVTDASRAFIWHIRQIVTGDTRKRPIPIGILEDACNGPGMSSATVFHSPERRRMYAFCTIDRASGSFQRSVLAPVARSSSGELVDTAKEFQHPLQGASSPIIVGTVNGDSRYLATVEREGEIRVFRTLAFPTGGLDCEEIITMQETSILCYQERVSPTSLRFHYPEQANSRATQQLQLFAIDLKGKLVIRTYSIE